MRILFVIAISLGTLCETSAQRLQKFDSLFTAYHINGLFDGTALIADSSGIIYHRSFGMANHATGDLNNPSTVFRLGSLEKQFTAMLVMQLVAKGKLNLKGTIADYLPEYRKDVATEVTIEHLLTHRSGIPNYTAITNVWDDSLQSAYKASYILKHFCSGNLESKPGEKYKYNNSGYFILAQIIERVTGKTLAKVLNDNILIPAGMKSTGLANDLVAIRNKALGYYRIGSIFISEPFIYAQNAIGAASIYSTANDLYLWDRLLYTNALLSESLLNTYTSPHVKIDPEYSYGFGWEFSRTALYENDTIQTMEHSGAIRAFRAVIFRLPAEKKCVIILSNSANESAYGLFENVMHIIRGRDWKKPQKVLADTLYAVTSNRSIAVAIQAFRNLKVNEPQSYDFSSSSLQAFGERLTMLKNYEAAKAVFELAVEEDIKYTSGYYYLGRIYEQWGKPEQAIEAYKMAVSMDAKSRTGIDAAFQIKHLGKLIREKSRGGKK